MEPMQQTNTQTESSGQARVRKTTPHLPLELMDSGELDWDSRELFFSKETDATENAANRAGFVAENQMDDVEEGGLYTTL